MTDHRRDLSLSQLQSISFDNASLYENILSCQRKQIHLIPAKDFSRYKKEYTARSSSLFSSDSKPNLDEKLPILEKRNRLKTRQSRVPKQIAKSTKSQGMLNSVNISRYEFPTISELEQDPRPGKSSEKMLKPKSGNPIQLYHRHKLQVKDKKSAPFYLSTPKTLQIELEEDSSLLHSVNLSCMTDSKYEESRFRDKKYVRKSIFKLLASN